MAPLHCHGYKVVVICTRSLIIGCGPEALWGLFEGSVTDQAKTLNCPLGVDCDQTLKASGAATVLFLIKLRCVLA